MCKVGNTPPSVQRASCPLGYYIHTGTVSGERANMCNGRANKATVVLLPPRKHKSYAGSSRNAMRGDCGFITQLRGLFTRERERERATGVDNNNSPSMLPPGLSLPSMLPTGLSLPSMLPAGLSLLSLTPPSSSLLTSLVPIHKVIAKRQLERAAALSKGQSYKLRSAVIHLWSEPSTA